MLQSVLDEMMVEQTDLVRLRMVRMSNVPDTLYMVSNAMPQCCHMISHQQISSNQSSPPSVVANEIPGKAVLVLLFSQFPVDSLHVSVPFVHHSIARYALWGRVIPVKNDWFRGIRFFSVI
jgi:hypothetical protein